MKKSDWVTKQMAAYGYRAELSAAGGYWVEVDWDFEDSRWELFRSLESIKKYLNL